MQEKFAKIFDIQRLKRLFAIRETLTEEVGDKTTLNVVCELHLPLLGHESSPKRCQRGCFAYDGGIFSL